MSSINYDLRKIKAFVFDIDGVLSREVVSLSPDGEPLRTANVKDGFAMQLAIKKGYHVAVITGGYTESVKIRFEKLGLQYIYMRCSIKMPHLEDFMRKTGLSPDQVLYAGDDLPDHPVMEKVGLPVAPADAAPEIKGISKYISPRKGGEGVARDVIEQTLKAQGNWMSEEAFGW